MTPDGLNKLKNNEATLKRLAKFMAHFCFRNSKLEDLHNRISDDEMKELMIDVVNRSYLFLWMLFKGSTSDDTIDILERGEHLPNDWSHWDDPDPPLEMVRGSTRLLKLLRERAQSDHSQAA
jgi:hypothetical protein